MTLDNSTLRKLWEKSLWQVGYCWDKAAPSSFYPKFLKVFSTFLGQILPPKTDNRAWNTNNAYCQHSSGSKSWTDLWGRC